IEFGAFRSGRGSRVRFTQGRNRAGDAGLSRAPVPLLSHEAGARPMSSTTPHEHSNDPTNGRVRPSRRARSRSQGDGNVARISSSPLEAVLDAVVAFLGRYVCFDGPVVGLGEARRVACALWIAASYCVDE